MEITEGDGYAILKWTNPSSPNYNLTKVIQKTGSAPTSLQDGKEIYSGKGTTVQANGLEVGSKYFWSVFTTNNLGKVSDPVSISYTPRTDPNSRPYDNRVVATWNNSDDVDNFFNRFNHNTKYADGDTELRPGNEIVINDGFTNIPWLIAGFDLEHNQKATDDTTYDNGYGICLVSKDCFGMPHMWGTTTSNGYFSSNIHNYLNTGEEIRSLLRILNNHIIHRNVLLSNTYGTVGGADMKWTNAYLTLLTLNQYNIVNYDRLDRGEATYILPLFKFINATKFLPSTFNYTIWTRMISRAGEGSGMMYPLTVSGTDNTVLAMATPSTTYNTRCMMYIR